MARSNKYNLATHWRKESGVCTDWLMRVEVDDDEVGGDSQVTGTGGKV